MYLQAQAKRQQEQEAQKQAGGPKAADQQPGKAINPELEQASLIAIPTRLPNQFVLHDIIVVIVREQKKYESDSTLEVKKRHQMEITIDEFFRVLSGHLAAASFTDGKPGIDFKMNNRIKDEGEVERVDKLTFRVAVEIIDIKPNGSLVLSGRKRIRVDEEVQQITFSGVCRSRDVTPDNTILSTQVFNQVVEVEHSGAVRDASKRGWLTRLIDRFNPF